MSENKGKAKVKSKSKSKSTMKSAGKNKAAVMNSRNPKKPMAISGDTMSNYAMYRAGGKVKKFAKGGSKLGTYQGPIQSEVMSVSAPPDSSRYSSKVLNDIIRQNLLTKEAMELMNKDARIKYMDDMKPGRSSNTIGRPIPRQKKGGVTKAKKFAALAPPYDKITAADRIAGAKKNARKK
jgi:hypothetical protein